MTKTIENILLDEIKELKARAAVDKMTIDAFIRAHTKLLEKTQAIEAALNYE